MISLVNFVPISLNFCHHFFQRNAALVIIACVGLVTSKIVSDLMGFSPKIESAECGDGALLIGEREES